LDEVLPGEELAVKFYGTGYAWDSKLNRIFCQFIDGVYETSDEKEIAMLMPYYEHDEISEKVEAEISDKPKRGRPKNAED
jgi:hypothetical protein